MSNRKSQLEKFTEALNNKKSIKEQADVIIINKDGAEQVQMEFEKFSDKEMHLLTKIVEVYASRIKTEQERNKHQISFDSRKS